MDKTASIADVDEEALCCPRCLQLLVPPVLQCAAGHLICSSCHDNLQDKNKCVSCFVPASFIPTSYSRCHAVEGILRSVRVACPNTIHGRCTAGKMLCHEKVEHEKTCPSTAAPGRLPSSVVKMGPCGGVDGNVREMDVRGVNRIVKVVVWYSSTFDAMKVYYERDGREEKTDRWGVPATESNAAIGGPSQICLEQDEYLTGVKGHIEYCGGSLCVISLTFVTNLHTFGPYGVEDGVPFELPAAAGGRIIGFHGRSDSYVDAIGTYVKMDL
ncbi:jacalin-related lectin 3-like [Lolium rigidum]|uniref:jacalin-related lectin 3-like n=1 Tax=Lolium rigidum TaxID=89674 RepID=UPI001F5D2F22|nr:jacalin-related lectin 3-like [Lolium rigidum]